MTQPVTNTGAGKPECSAFILVPVLNEIANIAELIRRIEAQGIACTIGILDDGSTDGTIEFVQQLMRDATHRIHLICRQKTLRASQRGKALRTLMLWGLENTDHPIFIEMDGDLSHRPEEFHAGVELLASGCYDVAIASKYMPGSAVTNRPTGRLMVSRVCSIAVACLLSRRIRDYSNGFRFYTREAAHVAADRAYRYGSPIYLSEILALWMRQGLRIVEFPSTYIGRAEGLSKLRIADLVKAAIAIFEISLRYHLLGFRRLRDSRKP